MKVEYGNVAEDAVWAGVDTHAATNWLSVVDARGSELFSGEFATDPEGYRKLCDEIRRLGSPVAAGVECTGRLWRRAREGDGRIRHCRYEVITPGRPRRGPGCDKDDAARRAEGGKAGSFRARTSPCPNPRTDGLRR